MTQKRALRRSQVISPAGVGAIVDILGESFVGMDTTHWSVLRIPIRAPRITGHLGVPELRMPPGTDDKSGDSRTRGSPRGSSAGPVAGWIAGARGVNGRARHPHASIARGRTEWSRCASS